MDVHFSIVFMPLFCQMIRVAFLSGSQSGLKENVGEYLIHWKLVVLFFIKLELAEETRQTSKSFSDSHVVV